MFGANMASVANLGRGRARLGTVSFDMFFDRQKLVGRANKAVFRALNRAGGATRLTAKRSMRARPLGKASMPGMPPHRHKQQRGVKAKHDYGLQRSILYGYDAGTQSVVIGPSAAFGAGIRRIAKTHEYGGFETKKNPRRKRRVRGGAGEIRVVKHRTQAHDKRGRYLGFKNQGATKATKDTLLGNVFITYGKLRTDEQVRRANQLNEALYGPSVLHSTYPPRPTMGPALAQVAPLLPGMIRDAWNK